MSLVRLPVPIFITTQGVVSFGTQTIDAANERICIVGRVRLPGGFGTSKVLSSAGGAIIWPTGARTFANAGTNIRLGVQDVNPANGLPDTTWDVFADLVPGVETINANAWNIHSMESGSKTIAHGDLIAIIADMTARAGADSVTIQKQILTLIGTGITSAGGSFLPYGVTNAAKDGTFSTPKYVLKFDDGTYGWINGTRPYNSFDNGSSAITFNSSSTPDEYCALFQVPFHCTIDACSFLQSAILSTADYKVRVYEDPLGTPALLIPEVSIDANILTEDFGVQPNYIMLGEDAELFPGVDYAISVLPGASNHNWNYYNLTSGFDVLKIQQPFSSIKMAARSDVTGPFVETQAYHLPIFSIQVSQMDDGA